MEAKIVVKERSRCESADYAEVIDDDIAIIDDDMAVIDDDEAVIDDDETVCDDDRDGLTPEEAEAYNNECKALSELSQQLIRILGWNGYKKWCRTYTA